MVVGTTEETLVVAGVDEALDVLGSAEVLGTAVDVTVVGGSVVVSPCAKAGDTGPRRSAPPARRAVAPRTALRVFVAGMVRTRFGKDDEGKDGFGTSRTGGKRSSPFLPNSERKQRTFAACSHAVLRSTNR
jgi:hypothetical protein